MDRTLGSSFEAIAQMLLEQKKLMDALETENRQLRLQLADLRRGVGICVVIGGKTVSLAIDTGPSTPSTDSTQPETESQGKRVDGGSENNGQPGKDKRIQTSLADTFVI